MAVHEAFKFENLGKAFGGTVPLLVNDQIQRVLRDCKDRFTDEKARTVRIDLRFSPVANEHGDEVNAEVQVTSSLPKCITRIHSLRIKANGDATFHPDFADDPNAEGLFDPHTGELREDADDRK